jgi:hypothetical protein
MAALTPGQQLAIRGARKALSASHQKDLGAASESDLRLGIGQLEIALETALRVLDHVVAEAE